jgi:hypothetical protein
MVVFDINIPFGLASKNDLPLNCIELARGSVVDWRTLLHAGGAVSNSDEVIGFLK